ncbi:YgaP family membrane protein [Thiogranum longum]
MRLNFKPNMSRFDQVVRIAIGLMLIYAGFVDTHVIADTFVASVVGVFGMVNIVVASIRFCPVYTLAGINTCHADQS